MKIILLSFFALSSLMAGCGQSTSSTPHTNTEYLAASNRINQAVELYGNAVNNSTDANEITAAGVNLNAAKAAYNAMKAHDAKFATPATPTPTPKVFLPAPTPLTSETPVADDEKAANWKIIEDLRNGITTPTPTK
jgi:hypothetical protein